MMYIYSLLLVLVTSIQSYVIKDHGENDLRFTPKYPVKKSISSNYYNPPAFFKRPDILDIKKAKNKAEVIRTARKRDRVPTKEIHILNDVNDANQKYHPDPLLNYLGKSRRKQTISLADTSSSSSVEIKNWKEEWKEHWLQKKIEAINSTVPKGDVVNMAAARPWGLPCGDPNQHDMPWGTCMLPMECEAEYRIYRGDIFCGRTAFVCCALQLTTYDLYQGFDVSFDMTSLETDSEEKRNRDRGSKEKRRRKKARDRARRRRERIKRKRKMKRNIKKIVREIQKILNKSYRNGTTDRKRKTRQLKKFVKILKKKYKEERKVVLDLHEYQLIQADVAVQERLNQIKNMNREFVKNGTYRDIIVNGTVNKNDPPLYVNAYPDIARILGTRRRGVKDPRDYMDYDVEYGYLYY